MQMAEYKKHDLKYNADITSIRKRSRIQFWDLTQLNIIYIFSEHYRGNQLQTPLCYQHTHQAFSLPMSVKTDGLQ